MKWYKWNDEKSGGGQSQLAVLDAKDLSYGIKLVMMVMKKMMILTVKTVLHIIFYLIKYNVQDSLHCCNDDYDDYDDDDVDHYDDDDDDV